MWKNPSNFAERTKEHAASFFCRYFTDTGVYFLSKAFNLIYIINFLISGKYWVTLTGLFGFFVIENEIDQETFEKLNSKDIKELIPVLGTRKKF